MNQPPANLSLGVLHVSRFLLLSCVCLVAPHRFAAQDGARESSGPTAPAAYRHGVVFAPGPGISPPRLMFSQCPDYPRWARTGKHKIQGSCVLDITVDERGEVHDIHVTRSLDKRLDKKAIDAVKEWKFKPATREGNPVAVRTSVEVEFRLF